MRRGMGPTVSSRWWSLAPPAASAYDRFLDFHEAASYLRFHMQDNWTATNVGGSSVIAADQLVQTLRSSATINSSTLNRAIVYGLRVGATGTFIDWTKKTALMFFVKTASDTEAVRRVQLKESNSTTIATLAVRGIGLQMDNLALTGEAYGTSRGTVDLSTSLTAGNAAFIAILLTSTGVEFFVDGVSKGSITTAGQFPAVAATAECNAFVTQANGGTGNNTDLECGLMAILGLR